MPDAIDYGAHSEVPATEGINYGDSAPTETEKPGPTVMERAWKNLPASAMQFIRNLPVFSGAPMGMQSDEQGKFPPMGPEQTWSDIKDAAAKVGHFFSHPLDTVAESFAKNPVGTVMVMTPLLS